MSAQEEMRSNFTRGTGEVCDYLDPGDETQFALLNLEIELYVKALAAISYELTYSFELHREDAQFFITVEDIYLYKVSSQYMIAKYTQGKQNSHVVEFFMKGRYCDEKNIAHTARYMKYQLYRNAIRQLIIAHGDKEKNITSYANKVIREYISEQEYIARLRTPLVGLLPVK